MAAALIQQAQVPVARTNADWAFDIHFEDEDWSGDDVSVVFARQDLPPQGFEVSVTSGGVLQPTVDLSVAIRIPAAVWADKKPGAWSVQVRRIGDGEKDDAAVFRLKLEAGLSALLDAPGRAPVLSGDGVSEGGIIVNRQGRVVVVRGGAVSFKMVDDATTAALEARVIALATAEAVSAAEGARALIEQARVIEEASRVQAEDGRVSAEGVRVDVEAARVVSEDARAAAETTRQAEETSRVDVEAARVISESQRVDAENARDLAEGERDAAEQTRDAQEVTRELKEDARQAGEQGRADAEGLRNTAEGFRAAAETVRIDQEAGRVAEEADRVSVEAARVGAEANRVAEEADRVSVEASRVDAETARVAFEGARVVAEGDRVEAEQGRVSVEAERVIAEDARELSEGGRAAAEALRVAEEEAREASEVARILAEDGRETTEDARVSAEGLRVDAEGDRVVVEAARVDAETLRVGAETDRADAEIIRSTAEGERSTAEGLRAGNEDVRVTQEAGRVDAETARVSVESDRVTAENAREEGEGERALNEIDRAAAEGVRISGEIARADAEGVRDLAELARIDAETDRDAEEVQRQLDEDARALAETDRAGAEGVRGASEDDRLAAEAIRVVQENARVLAEEGRAVFDTKNGHTPAQAWAVGQPILVRETSVLVMDFSDCTTDLERGARLKAYTDWHARCVVVGDGFLKLRFVEGDNIRTDGVYVRPGPESPDLAIDTEFAPTAINMTSVTFTNVSGYDFTVHIRLAAELPAYVVPGWVLRARNVAGDGDARAATNLYIAQTIDGDRMGFTGKLTWRQKLTLDNPTTLNMAYPVDGVPSCQVLVPRACLVAVGGWDGTAVEGFFDIVEGARLNLRHLGLGYDGPVSTQRELVFIGRRSRLYAGYVCMAGGGDSVLRTARHLGVDLIHCGIGCAGSAVTAASAELGGPFSSERTEFCGGSGRTFVATGSPHCHPGGAIIGGLYAWESLRGTLGILENTRIYGSQRAIYLSGDCTVIVGAGTHIDGAGAGSLPAIDVLAGLLTGAAPTLGSYKANVADYGTNVRPGVAQRGGLIRYVATVPPTPATQYVSAGIAQVWRCALAGEGGGIKALPVSGLAVDHFAEVIYAGLVTGTPATAARAMGASAALGTGDPSTWDNPGKTTFGVYVDGGGALWFAVKNQRAGASRYRFAFEGDLAPGLFALV